MYVCMSQHNYLSVNGIVSFPSFTWLYKYKEEYKQGEMWHSAQRAEISEEICMFQPGCCQATGTWLISTEINNDILLIARQRFRNHRYIDSNNSSWRLWKERWQFHFALLLDGINISTSIRREQCGMLLKRSKYLRQIGYMYVCSG
jgi:hypothetical protein